MQLLPNRVRWRLTIWYAISLSMIFLVFSGGLYYIVLKACMAPIHVQIDKEFILLEKTTIHAMDDLPALEAKGLVPAFLVKENGRSLYSTRSWINAHLPDNLTTELTGYQRIESESGRHYFLREATISNEGKTYRIWVAQDIEQAYDSLKKLAHALLFGFPLVLLVSLLGGYVFAGRVLSPIRAMAHKAQEITADKLSERLPIHDPEDEFGHLASIFNHAFMRLEDSFERMRRFTADASHELRTPLTVIRSVSENALQHGHDPSRFPDTIGSILEETDRMVRLLDDLLTLSRAESGQLPLKIEDIDIAELSLDTVNCLRVLAEEKHQHLSFYADEKILMPIGRATVKQAIINLVTNAIRYTSNYGRIDIKVRRVTNGHCLIEVCDNGPGIAAEHQSKIFDRFYRVDADRSRETGGAGLGLAIARWAVELNGGAIELESTVGVGSIFRIILKPDRR
jgi:heavy metal sensor kinase